MENYSQVCVWPGTVVGEGDIKEFEEFMLGNFSARVVYCEEVKTLPTPGEPDTGGRNDLFFRVHEDDIMKFAIPRLAVGIRWWEDVLLNGGGVLYTEDVLERYPATW